MEINEDDDYQEPYSEEYYYCYVNPTSPGCQTDWEQVRDAVLLFGAVVGGPTLVEGGVWIVETVGAGTVAVRVAKATAEELGESAMTGRKPDPVNILLDAATEVGDEYYQAAKAGVRVYRVWGGDPDDPDIPSSGPWGHSWTPVDPSSVPDYRQEAGLPSGGQSGAVNSGRFVSVGTVTDPSGVRVRTALALDQQAGGMTEFVIPNPEAQVSLEGVYGVNPPY
jgi:hypothetical protein